MLSTSMYKAALCNTAQKSSVYCSAQISTMHLKSGGRPARAARGAAPLAAARIKMLFLAFFIFNQTTQRCRGTAPIAELRRRSQFRPPSVSPVHFRSPDNFSFTAETGPILAGARNAAVLHHRVQRRRRRPAGDREASSPPRPGRRSGGPAGRAGEGKRRRAQTPGRAGRAGP